MATFIQAKVKGAKEIERAFKKLDERLKKRTLRASVQEGRKVFLKALRARAPKQSGLLRKSLGTRAKSYKKGLIATQTIGPRSGFKREVTFKTEYFRKERGRRVKVGERMRKEWRDPRRYAHITEKRNPWIRPVFEAYSGQALSVTSGKLKMELEIAIRASSTAGAVR